MNVEMDARRRLDESRRKLPLVRAGHFGNYTIRERRDLKFAERRPALTCCQRVTCGAAHAIGARRSTYSAPRHDTARRDSSRVRRRGFAVSTREGRVISRERHRTEKMPR